LTELLSHRISDGTVPSVPAAYVAPSVCHLEKPVTVGPRMAPQLVGPSLLYDASVVEDDHVIAQVKGLAVVTISFVPADPRILSRIRRWVGKSRGPSPSSIIVMTGEDYARAR
jgi:hypothetical protein